MLSVHRTTILILTWGCGAFRLIKLAYPKISVVLPCYNHAIYLEDRIQSVLAQTLPVSQIIFLDDASTDDSVKLAKIFLRDAQAEVSYVLNTCNSGSTFAQWNKGLSLVRHPYVWIAETDDACQPNLLERLYSKIVNLDTVIAFSQSCYIDNAGNELGSALAYTDSFFPNFFAQDFVISGLEFNSEIMAVINAIPNASAALFRTSMLKAAGFANESMRFCGDWDFWLRIAKQGNVAFVAEELNRFRCHQHTTRVMHKIPQASAEFLACRLRAQLGAQCSRDILDLRSLMQLLSRQNRRAILFSLNSILWVDLSQVFTGYKLISEAPVVSLSIWSIIGILSLINCLYLKAFVLIHLLAPLARSLRKTLLSVRAFPS
jgi:glycosyltransferase involved in cell wall biosynthesis